MAVGQDKTDKGSWLLSGPAYLGAIELTGSTEETANAIRDRLHFADGNLAPVVREAADLRSKVDLAETIANHHLRDHADCGYIKTRDQALIERGCCLYDHGAFTLCEVELARRRASPDTTTAEERDCICGEGGEKDIVCAFHDYEPVPDTTAEEVK